MEETGKVEINWKEEVMMKISGRHETVLHAIMCHYKNTVETWQILIMQKTLKKSALQIFYEKENAFTGFVGP